jgi:hypothetical protein
VEEMKYRGLELEQTVGTLEVFREFLTAEKFDMIIELGTKYGGLTQFLTELHDNIHTFDVGEYMKPGLVGYLKSVGVTIYVEDIFQTNNVKELIEFPLYNRVLLLCDNGNKIAEVQKFTPYLKTNDVIMAHDYFPTENDLYHTVDYGDGEKIVKRWSSHEISEKDIDSNILKPCFDKFESVFWLCRRRK